jgi:hypothetical protein
MGNAELCVGAAKFSAKRATWRRRQRTETAAQSRRLFLISSRKKSRARDWSRNAVYACAASPTSNVKRREAESGGRTSTGLIPKWCGGCAHVVSREVLHHAAVRQALQWIAVSTRQLHVKPSCSGCRATNSGIVNTASPGLL